LRLVNENRSEAEFQNALALSYNSIGLLLSEIDEDQALSDYKQALSILTTLVTDHPTITLYKIELASTCRSVSSLSRAMNLLAPAMKLGEVAFTIDKELADVHPSVVQIQRELAASYNNYGNLLMDDSEPAKALNYLELALPIWQKLADAHPTVTQFQSELATCHNNINIVVKAIGEPKKASTPR
jgi:tetratricopeptide (TPR) repeat protein